MSDNLKDIHVGSLIKRRVIECEIDISRICNFFKCTEKQIMEWYEQEDMTTNILLKWSKLLEYDFFRLYSHHLILYAPPGNINPDRLLSKKKSTLPEFRKNIYTKEIINFIVELIGTGEKTMQQIIDEYRIPKTTLYTWLRKYKKST